MNETPTIERALELARIDLAPAHRPPGPGRVALATVLSLVGSLVADALVVAIGTSVFPTTTGYVHFHFSDYAKLTVVGVVVACLAWPIVTRLSWAPRWLYLRLAVLVTLVLLLPDIWLLLQREPLRAVVVLMVMHLVIAFVTYTVMVHLAPVRPGSGEGTRRGVNGPEPAG